MGLAVAALGDRGALRPTGTEPRVGWRLGVCIEVGTGQPSLLRPWAWGWNATLGLLFQGVLPAIYIVAVWSPPSPVSPLLL